MIFDYFMLDTVDRNIIRKANNNLIKLASEIWVFGEISDGVLAEIKIGKKMKKPIRYFKIKKSKKILEISKNEVIFEEDLEKYKKEL